jgi:hypothetical protein
MKRFKFKLGYALCILLAFSYSVSGQNETLTSILTKNDTINLVQKADTTLNPICKVRGHVCGGVVSTTDMYCSPYTIDTDSCTIKVYPSCNWISYQCVRCREWVSEKEPERREVIWRKEE